MTEPPLAINLHQISDERFSRKPQTAEVSFTELFIHPAFRRGMYFSELANW
jgi:hypothetical protein